MCGIYFSCNSENADINERVNNFLKNRGPNSSGTIKHKNLLFGGYVLWQQGNKLCPQPVETENIILLFNGDIFNIDHIKPHDLSDVEWLADRLSICETENDIRNLFKWLEGPFSIVFYDKRLNVVYFARDSLGRNSLLIEKDEKSLRILSTSFISGPTTKTIEVPSLGLFKLSGQNFNYLTLFPWIPEYMVQEQFNSIIDFTECFENLAISPKWVNNPAGSVKVAFDFYDLCDKLEISSVDLYQHLLENKTVAQEIEKFCDLLENSVRNRVQKTLKYCTNCIFDQKTCCHSKIAILFSGGIDCSILAVLVNKFADIKDSIDLINIACEDKNLIVDKWNVPDRISAKSSLIDLQNLCPSRKWNFIEVNVTRDECRRLMTDRLKHLIYPLNTVLDESLGTAFWFASQGDGLQEKVPYKTPARVVIIGSGADELFGGYKRYKNAYHRCYGSGDEKHSSVDKELEKDWLRISSRNLARDDRIVGDTSKTLRAPFIEGNLVQYVKSLKSNQLSCYLLEDGIGDKLFLRLFGYKLGLSVSPFLKKRAIQFGTKLANKKQNAKDISEYFM